jgi:hypothetical protein
MPACQITLLGRDKLMPQRMSQTFLRRSAPLTGGVTVPSAVRGGSHTHLRPRPPS